MNKHKIRPNRFAKIIAEVNGLVLYHAYEGNKIIYPNMARSAEDFYAEY